MSTSYHTNARNSGRYKTIIVIIGVLVALMIGYGVTAASLGQDPVCADSLENPGVSMVVSSLENGFSVLLKVTSALF